MPYWAVVQTIANREPVVVQRLTRLGFQTLTPKARFRLNGRTRVAALFPGYLFAAIVEQWYAARWCEGVSRLVMASEQPAHMPDAVIEKLQREMDKAGLVQLPKPPPPPGVLRPGTRVRVHSGPLRGHLGVYAGMTAQDRIVVLLQLLGAERQIELAKDDVVPVSK